MAQIFNSFQLSGRARDRELSRLKHKSLKIGSDCFFPRFWN
jgi:hypothetical protein